MAASKPMKRAAVMRKKAVGVSSRAMLPGLKGKLVRSKATKAPKGLGGLRASVINLDARTDRWERLQKSVRKQARWLPLDRLSAVNGKKAPPSLKEVTRTWSTARLAQLFHWYKSMTITMSPGERGCCASHVKAWRLAAKGKGPLLVLEDDAVALSSFESSVAQAIAEAPRGTGMVWLSSKDRGYPKPLEGKKVLMKPHYVWTTVGYLIWPAAARQLLRMLPMDMPVDNFLAWHIREGKILAYSVKPAAVRQAQTWNVGSDVPHSCDVAH